MNIIVACDENYGIGLKNSLPWKLKDDMAHFKKHTTAKPNNIVIMGRNTYESLKKALPNRINFVLSPTLYEKLEQEQQQEQQEQQQNEIMIYKTYNNFFVFKTLDDAHVHALYLSKLYSSEIWVIGGAQLYESVVMNCEIKGLYVTRIDKVYECDAFLKENTQELLTNTYWTNTVRMSGDDDMTYTFYEKCIKN